MDDQKAELSVVENHAPLLLLIDDSNAELDALGELLTRNNFSIAHESCGLKGFANAELAHPEVILISTRILRSNSPDLVQILKENEKTCAIPIILISNGDIEDAHDISTWLDHGADDYVGHPLQSVDLLRKIDTQLRSTRNADQIDYERKFMFINELIATTSHDISQPLTSIICNVELLLKKSSRHDPNYKRVEYIHDSALRIQEIMAKVKELRDYYSKPRKKQPAHTDLQESCSSPAQNE